LELQALTGPNFDGGVDRHKLVTDEEDGTFRKAFRENGGRSCGRERSGSVHRSDFRSLALHRVEVSAGFVVQNGIGICALLSQQFFLFFLFTTLG
jgi:hypothetical protein